MTSSPCPGRLSLLAAALLRVVAGEAVLRGQAAGWRQQGQGAGPEEECASTESDRCRNAAAENGLQFKGGLARVKKNDIKGCHAYASGNYEGNVYYGWGGTEEERTSAPLDCRDINPVYRPPNFDCSCSEVACKDAAEADETLQWGGAGNYATKGCYTYKEGKYQNKVYYGRGGDVTAMSQDIDYPKERLMSVCTGNHCSTKSTECICSERACREAAIRKELKRGGVGNPFAGNWPTKGCYTYKEGSKYHGHVYWSTGGDMEAMSEDVSSTEQERLDDCQCSASLVQEAIVDKHLEDVHVHGH